MKLYKNGQKKKKKAIINEKKKIFMKIKFNPKIF